jgi:hypothetical protein
MLKARHNQLNHFVVDMSKFRATAQYIVSIIKVGLYLGDSVNGWFIR